MYMTMKRFSYLFCGMMLLASMTSCNQDEPQKPAESQSYTMTIQATKGSENDSAANGSIMRVLSLDGSTLTASWAKGERVTVYNVTKTAEMEGYLEAQTAGTSTTLSGTLTGAINQGDVLQLKFLSPSYSTQDGTLEYISTHCDYAEATATVASVGGGNITTTESAAFVNKQAIVKFTLKKKSDDSDLEIPAAATLTVNGYTVTPASTTNVLFVAIPATSTVILTTDLYGYRKTDDNLIVAGKYYEITVKMSPRLAVKHSGEENYTAVTANTTLVNGDVVTGTLFEDFAISIASGATVTLSGVTINQRGSCAGIICQTNATITLDGTNVIQAPANYPGILVGNGLLTINGSGSLTVVGGADAAGIGSRPESACGNILIEGGTIDATGGTNAAAIGCSVSGMCGYITLSGGTISATCGSEAAATIGKSNRGSICGDITINGTHSVTLNNPNNSGSPVSSRTFMDTGNTIHLAQMAWSSDSHWEIPVGEAYLIQDNTLNVKFGCLTAQQFVYRPVNQ